MRWTLAVSVLALLGLLPAGPPQQFTDWSPAVNLAEINSTAVESCVAVSRDRLMLIFSSMRPGGLGNRDLYVSTRGSADVAWGVPQPLTMLNTAGWESCPALSVDESRLYFTTYRAPNCGDADIWVSTREDRDDPLGWGEPESLGCEQDGYVNTPGYDLTPTFFQDEAGNEVMYFASNHGTGYGAPSHFYQSVMRGDGTFGPATLVDELNSSASDVGITVRHDGLEVFLLSTRRGGSGVKYSYDFWRSTRASTADAWSKPVFVPSLGSPALANGRIALSYDGRELYFASRRVTNNLDIWVARRERLPGPR